MQEPFTSVINSVLSVGHGLPIPKQFKGELSKTRLFTYDHFLMIESDPRIVQRSRMVNYTMKGYFKDNVLNGQGSRALQLGLLEILSWDQLL